MAAFWALTRRSSLAGPSSDRRGDRRTPRAVALPGARQRRRLLVAWLAAALVFLLRPWPPFQWLPGWCVGVLLLWAIGELIGWLWWPQRSA